MATEQSATARQADPVPPQHKISRISRSVQHPLVPLALAFAVGLFLLIRRSADRRDRRQRPALQHYFSPLVGDEDSR